MLRWILIVLAPVHSAPAIPHQMLASSPRILPLAIDDGRAATTDRPGNSQSTNVLGRAGARNPEISEISTYETMNGLNNLP